VVAPPLLCRSFVGRDAERAYLLECWREAAASRGSFVLVNGEAGVGKSRLIDEFRAGIEKSRARVAVAQCEEFVQPPYGPILDVLGQLDPGAATAPSGATQREVFDALIASFERIAARRMIVAVIEDLHAADVATLAFLAYWASRLATTRVLVIGSCRSDDLEASHPTLAAISALSAGSRVGRIELEPLTGSELRVFIDDALGDSVLPKTVLRAIARASEGNPFLTEELLKNAVEAGSRQASPAEPASLPPSLHVALARRLLPFDRAERRILTQAAVIGRVFAIELLAATLATTSDALVRTIRRARDFQLIEEHGATLRFRHALTREAIYVNCDPLELRSLHVRIATVLEALPSEERSIESLAYHWYAADDRPKALYYSERAGDAAGQVFAHDDAIAAYQRGIRALEREQLRAGAHARLLEKVGRHSIITGSNEAGLAAYADAATIYELLGDAEKQAECNMRVAVQRFRAGVPNPTASLELQGEARDAPGECVHSRIHVGLAHVAALQYKPGLAEHHLRHVDASAIADNAELRYTLCAARAMVLYLRGDTAGFRAAIEPWLYEAQASSDSGLLAQVHNYSALYLSILGQHAEARGHIERALAIARGRRDRMSEAAAHAASAWGLLLTGDLAGVRGAVDAMRTLPTDSEVITAHGCAWGTLAGVHLGDDALIAYWFDRLERRLPSFAAAIYAAGCAEILVARGREPEARALLHRALDYGELPRGIFFTLLAVARFGDPTDFAQARTYLIVAAATAADVVERPAIDLFDAYVARRARDGVRARALAAVAAVAFHDLGYPLLEAAALEVAGDVQAALRVYRRLGASGDVIRLDSNSSQPATEDPSVPPRAANGLSPREYEVATLVAGGRSNLKIAQLLAISQKTVEAHLGSAYFKLGLSSRTQLTRYITGTLTGDGTPGASSFEDAADGP